MLYTPIPHPFIERVIGTCRREVLDRTLFWNARDLQNKLDDFKQYYNAQCLHMSISCHTPANKADNIEKPVLDINHYRRIRHCQGLFDLPVAAQLLVLLHSFRDTHSYRAGKKNNLTYHADD